MGSLQQTRDALGSSDQTADQVFCGVFNEKLKFKIVNEVITVNQTDDGIILDSTLNNGLDDPFHGLDGTVYIVSEITRRQWNWKSEEQLRTGNTANGTLVEGGVRIDLTI